MTAWTLTGWRIDSVTERLKRCRQALSKWKHENNINSRERLSQVQVALEFEQSKPFPENQRVRVLTKELIRAYREKEAFWSQKI